MFIFSLKGIEEKFVVCWNDLKELVLCINHMGIYYRLNTSQLLELTINAFIKIVHNIIQEGVETKEQLNKLTNALWI